MAENKCVSCKECEEYKKLLEKYEDALEKSTQYTDIIITIGYVGFFNLFLIIKDALSTELKTIISIFILVSLTTFIIWETIKMLLHSINEARHYLDKNSLKIILFTVWIIFFGLIAITFAIAIFFLAKGLFLYLLK